MNNEKLDKIIEDLESHIEFLDELAKRLEKVLGDDDA